MTSVQKRRADPIKLRTVFVKFRTVTAKNRTAFSDFPAKLLPPLIAQTDQIVTGIDAAFDATADGFTEVTTSANANGPETRLLDDYICVKPHMIDHGTGTFASTLKMHGLV